MWDILAIVILVLTAIPAGMTLTNLLLYRQPETGEASLPAVSVLIPARDEERAIVPAVRSVLESEAGSGLDFEVVVMDDHSSDATAERVLELAEEDPRVRLVEAPALPAGWFGKPHACQRLAEAAKHDVLLWMDADVRIEKGGLRALVAGLERSDAGLVSTVPRQVTDGLMEKLVIHQILYVLLGYLPMLRMKQSTSPAYGAACGQLMVARRGDYVKAGGHAVVRGVMHESLALSRAFRKAGIKTDLVDGTALARCKMYETAGQVWHGFAKNAHEGMGSPGAIVPWTVFLLGGQVLPWLIGLAWGLGWIEVSLLSGQMIGASMGAALFTSLLLAWKFRQGVLAGLLRPLGMVVLVAIQWYAMVRSLRGRPVTWRGRAYAGAN
ncbi:glycosyltransferase [Mucisphaera sp.]|uniref:glycosyltransferase n=1 Tax=Mucisphaera sp. TaxID=2913024 RepID=UPI003D0F01F4